MMIRIARIECGGVLSFCLLHSSFCIPRRRAARPLFGQASALWLSAVCLALLPVGGCFGPGASSGGSSSATDVNGSSGSAPDGATTRPAPRASDARRRFPLDSLPTSTVQIHGQTVRVWLVRTPDQQQEGLMHVPAEEIADDQGMLFVFPDEDLRFFWMKNTITSLDIAYARADGLVVSTWTMPPLTLQSFPSIEPALFVLEMKAGAFARLGLRRGDTIAIPPEVFQDSD
jgi:uncharacterized membrane protein (UPF0127 family)